jgi:hypothetical protein
MILHKNVQKRFGFIALGLLIMALGAVPAQAEHAVLSVSGVNLTPDTSCALLKAGQTISAGTVCWDVSADGTMLDVTYTTSGGWELTEAHLWVGENQDGYPMAKKGNPKVGNFPYNSGDITGTTTYSFSVPLGSVQSFFDLDNLDLYCGVSGTIYSMAHAAVRKGDGSGGYQTETGWSDGEGAVQKGSWATRTTISLSVTCDQPPGPGPTTGQETAIMLGAITLNDSTDDYCNEFVDTDKPADGVPDTWVDSFDANRWGWQEGPLSEGSYTKEIWAAAGNNVLANGTKVGHVDIVISDQPAPGNVTVTPVFLDGFTPEETHIYIGTEPVCSGAFGKDWDELASTDIDISGGVFVGVHFSVKAECGINPESPRNFCEKE